MNRDDWKAILLVLIIVVASTAAALYAISVTRKGIDSVFWPPNTSPRKPTPPQSNNQPNSGSHVGAYQPSTGSQAPGSTQISILF